jgi:hypothetical protein
VAAHLHLKRLDKTRFSLDYFLSEFDSVVNSLLKEAPATEGEGEE